MAKPLSLSLQIQQGQLQNDFNQILSTEEKNIKSYINNHDYKNVPPAIGYIDEYIYPVYGTYNMSFTGANNFPDWAISDSTGREIVYVRAAADNYATIKMYRAYRFTDNSDFTFENTPVKPAYFNDTQYIERIYGLGCEWIACRVLDTANSSFSANHLIYTDGNSYTSWTKYTNIDSLITDINWQFFMVFRETETLGVIRANGTARNLYIYNKDKQLVAGPIKLYDLADIVSNKLGGSTVYHKGNHFARESYCYNEYTHEIFAYSNMEIITKDANTGVSNSWYRFSVSNTFTVDNAFLKTGTGKFEPLFDDSTQLRYDDTLGTGSMINRTDYCANGITYDDYTRQYRMIRKFWDSSEQRIYKLDATKKKTSSYPYENLIRSTTFFSSDACPWAKGLSYSAFFLNGRLFFAGRQSKKFGSPEVSADYNLAHLSNSVLSLIPGRWYMTESVAGYEGNGEKRDPIYYQQQMISSGNVRPRIACNWGGKFYEIIFSDATKGNLRFAGGYKRAGNAIAQAPSLPSGYGSTSVLICYNEKTNKFWGFAGKTLPDNDWTIVLLEYSVNSGAWTEHSLDSYTSFMTYVQYDKNNFGGSKRYSSFQSKANWFIDDDGYMYTAVYHNHAPGTAVSHSFCISPSGVVSGWRYIHVWYFNKSIGYDPTFGYYYTYDNGYNGCWIYHTKNIENGTTTASLSNFRAGTGSWNTSQIGLQSATGLVAYTQAIPVLVNGKCRTIDSTDIILSPNCTNYIYVVGKDDAFTLEARTTKGFKTGENAFNTILIAEVDTNAADPIATRYYEINN